MVLASESTLRTVVASLVLVIALSTACDDVDIPTKGKTGWTSLGLEGLETSNIVLVRPYLYACAGVDGLYRRGITRTKGRWQYLGLADSASGGGASEGVSDIEVLEDGDVLIALASLTVNGEAVPTIYRSEDDGLTWQRSDTGIGGQKSDDLGDMNRAVVKVTLITSALCGETVLLAGTEHLNDVFKSVDTGLNWFPVGGCGYGQDLQGHPRSCTVWCGGQSGRESAFITKSSDGGLSWDYVGSLGDLLSFPNCVLSIAPDPADPDIVYATTCTDSVAKTEDGGKSWVFLRFCAGAPRGQSRLIVEPHNSTHLFLGSGAFVHESWDGGETFESVEVPDGSEITDMEYDSNATALYVATDRGIYRYRTQ